MEARRDTARGGAGPASLRGAAVSEVDLIVVGGGPAGATTAAMAAAAGLRVTLAERERFPRRKLCGDFVSGEGHAVLRRLGVLDRLRAAGASPIDRVLVTTAAGRSFETPLPSASDPPAFAVSRAVLDECLLRCAGESGADVLEDTEVVGLVTERGRVAGARLRTRGGRQQDRRARAVVAADGRRGTVARLLGMRRPAARGRRAAVGIQGHLERIAPRVGRRVELHFVRGGYLGLAVIEGGLVNAALLVSRERVRTAGHPTAVLESIAAENPVARQRLEGARLVGSWKTIGALRFGTAVPASRGVFFVGDSAGTVDPFAGEGVAHALVGGEALAGLLAECPPTATHADLVLERRWSRIWRRLFRRTTWMCRGFGLVAVRPGALETVVAACARSGTLAAGLVAATRPRRFVC
jgi:flavin-dependent dehydrogenase